MCKDRPTPLLQMGQINENAYHSQDIVAWILKIPANKVMCHVKRVGGAFGGKAQGIAEGFTFGVCGGARGTS